MRFDLFLDPEFWLGWISAGRAVSEFALRLPLGDLKVRLGE